MTNETVVRGLGDERQLVNEIKRKKGIGFNIHEKRVFIEGGN